MSLKKNENILIDSSISLNSAKLNSINEIENIQKNCNDYNFSKNSKRVKFIDQPNIIDVESWKKYNLEYTEDENFDNYIEEIQKNQNNENKNNNNNINNDNNIYKKNNKRNKKDDITCTCNII